MILVDAIYINNSGGKILLDYLIETLEKEGLVVHYLLDNRIKKNHPEISNNKVTYLKSGLIKRHKFYKQNKKSFSKVLCFGNLPPSIKLNAKVFTYFHQKLFLEIPQEISFKQKKIFFIKSLIFRFFKRNTDFWIVQTKVMGQIFNEVLKEMPLIIPFYPTMSSSNLGNRKSDGFVYVSSGSVHKNHKKLLQGFSKFYDENRRGELHLTISDEFKLLLNDIKILQEKGYPIFNHGFIRRDLLGNIYSANSFTIYPSLSESFGLGIIEAIENGCNVIGADLPYTYAVCNPSFIFDPHDIENIANSFKLACGDNIIPTEQLVFNEIDKLIALLN